MAPTNQLKEFAGKFIKALESLQVDEMIALRLPECTQQVYPSSMGYPLMDIEAFRRTYTPVLPRFQRFKTTVHSTTIDTDQNKVVLHVSTDANTIAGAYGAEAVYILHVNEDGTKLKAVEEFVDSGKSKEEGAKLRAAIAKENESTA